MTPSDPHNPAHWQPGDRFTVYPARETFSLQTIAGMVYVQPGTYRRFIWTNEGWRLADDE